MQKDAAKTYIEYMEAFEKKYNFKDPAILELLED